MIANGGKDRFSQSGREVGSSVYAGDLLHKLYLNVGGMLFEVSSKLHSFASRNL